MKGKGQDIHELTRLEAYLLSEKAGHPAHMHDYFWSQAEAIVRQRAAVVDIAVKAAGKKAPKVSKAKSEPAAKPATPAKKPAAKKTPEPQLPLDGGVTAKPPAAKSKKAAPASKPAAKSK